MPINKAKVASLINDNIENCLTYFTSKGVYANGKFIENAYFDRAAKVVLLFYKHMVRIQRESEPGEESTIREIVGAIHTAQEELATFNQRSRFIDVLNDAMRRTDTVFMPQTPASPVEIPQDQQQQHAQQQPQQHAQQQAQQHARAKKHWAAARKILPLVTTSKGKGIFPTDELLQNHPEFLRYLLEVVDPKHRDPRQLYDQYTTWLNSNYKGDFTDWLDEIEKRQGQIQRVTYIANKNELDKYELSFDSNGIARQRGKPYDTKNYGGKMPEFAIFIIDPKTGKLYASPYEIGKSHHTSLLYGHRVKAAGMARFIDGKLVEFSMVSGHYNPGAKELANALDTFKNNHIDLTNVTFINQAGAYSNKPGGGYKSLSRIEIVNAARSAGINQLRYTMSHEDYLHNHTSRVVTTNVPVNKMKQQDYLAAIKAQPMDSSEFILITSMFLGKNSSHSDIQNTLSRVYQSYLKYDYKTAIQLLLTIAEDSINNKELTHAILARSSHLNDDPERNESRRYFETRYADELVNEMNTNRTFKSAAVLIPLLSNKAYVNSQNIAAEDKIRIANSLPKSINGYNDAKKVILLANAFNDTKEAMELKRNSPHYTHKERIPKRSETASEKSKANKWTQNITVMSSNPGIMKSTNPMFGDQQLDEPVTARNPDLFTLPNAGTGFSSSNRTTPFVGGVAGSIFGLIILLREYMHANKSSPTLEKDVNNVIKLFQAEYIKNGFHSLMEMQAIFKETQIQNIFSMYNVRIDSSLSETALQRAMRDTQEYAKEITLKRAMHQELPVHRPLRGASPATTAEHRSKARLFSIYDKPPKLTPAPLDNDKLAFDLLEFIKARYPTYGSKISAIIVEGDQFRVLTISAVDASDHAKRRQDKIDVRDELFGKEFKVKCKNISGYYSFFASIEDVKNNLELMKNIEQQHSPKRLKL